ncbi:xanthine dehydrogenase accessory protein XdhC [soil metagenome]
MTDSPAGSREVDWLDALVALRRDRKPAVIVRVATVRGHAPREAGAKMVVTAASTWGSVGGGNLEETGIARARDLLDGAATTAEQVTMSLNDVTRTDHGRQCCGGEVTLLLEPVPVRRSIAVFGLGHVGRELARILVRHDVELHLVDSRATYVDDAALAPLRDGPATVVAHHAPLPEVALGELPCGSHVVVMSHDHAEDFALCDAALRCGHLSSVGLIGSSAKWRRFERGLGLEGHSPESIARIRCPIGDPQDFSRLSAGAQAKQPAVIALAVATEVLSGVRSSVQAP